MPIYTEGSVGDEAPLGDFTTSFGYSLGTAVEDAWTGNPSVVVKDYLKYRSGGGSKLDYEMARERAKLGGVTLRIPEGGMDADALDMLIERKQDERARQTALARAPAGVIPTTARFAANMATSMLDPINIASAFVPVVSEARYAGMLARAEGALGRAAVRARIGATEGVVGAALVEPLVYAGRTQLGDDYAMSDSLMNLAVGAGLGAGFHAAGGAVGDRLGISSYATQQAREAAEAAQSYAGKVLAGQDDARISVEGLLSKQDAAIERIRMDLDKGSAIVKVAEMSPEGREASLRAAVAQAVEGRMPDVEAVAAMDRQGNFNAWFGKSQVADPNGQPIVLYHGTAAALDSFDPAKLSAEGIHLSTDADQASVYAASRAMDGGKGANVVPVYVKAEKVKDVDFISTDTIREAREQGFDAVRRGDHYVVMEPGQLKSAIGNSGRFDPNSASLTDPVSAAKATAARQASPEALAVGDPRASKAADETIANAPKDEAEEAMAKAMEAFDAKLRTIEADNPELAKRLREEMKPFDEAVKEAKSLGKAAEAAAACGMKE
jgi:hypothetical protein